MENFKVQKKEHICKTVRLPKDLADRLEELFRNTGVSFNQLVIQCCQYALEHLDSEN